MFDCLQREKDAFELFKEAYRAQFSMGAVEPLPFTELELTVPEPVVEADAISAGACLLFVPLDATLFADVDEGRFAEIACFNA